MKRTAILLAGILALNFSSAAEATHGFLSRHDQHGPHHPGPQQAGNVSNETRPQHGDHRPPFPPGPKPDFDGPFGFGENGEDAPEFGEGFLFENGEDFGEDFDLDWIDRHHGHGPHGGPYGHHEPIGFFEENAFDGEEAVIGETDLFELIEVEVVGGDNVLAAPEINFDGKH